MNISLLDLEEENKFDAVASQRYSAGQAISLALDAVEIGIINIADFVYAMRAWNEGAEDEFREIIDG